MVSVCTILVTDQLFDDDKHRNAYSWIGSYYHVFGKHWGGKIVFISMQCFRKIDQT